MSHEIAFTFVHDSEILEENLMLDSGHSIKKYTLS